MKKRRSKLQNFFLILFLISWYVLFRAIGENYLKPVVDNVAKANSYVQTIDTPSNGNKNIKKILDEFNILGDNKVVNYSSGIRPIKIYEVNIQELNNDKDIDADFLTLAQTERTSLYCIIRLTKNLGCKLRYVLLHEYLHCFWFEHNKEEDDLMNSTLMELPSEDNIESYAKKLLEAIENTYGR